jgi:hypothetical protein
MPMITDAVNEKIVRRDMLFSFYRCQKAYPLVAGLDDFGASLAGEPQPAAERCALCRCLVDLDQHSRLGTACIGTVHQTRVRSFDLERKSSPVERRFLFWGCLLRSTSRNGARRDEQDALSGARSDVTERSALDRAVLEITDVESHGQIRW